MKSAIYSILNTRNGKRYVGVTRHVESRWADHLSALRRNAHHSYRLQEDWDIGKEEDFVVRILEVDVPEDIRHDREQFWMDEYKSYEKDSGYNISPTAGTTLGRRHRPEARAMMSLAHKGKELTDEHKKAISESMKGMVKSEEHQQKITEALGNRSLSKYARGESVGGVKLKEEQVINILQEIKAGAKQLDLADKYQVSQATISAISQGRNWKHVYEKFNEVTTQMEAVL